jgi:hypothetical protein
MPRVVLALLVSLVLVVAVPAGAEEEAGSTSVPREPPAAPAPPPDAAAPPEGEHPGHDAHGHATVGDAAASGRSPGGGGPSGAAPVVPSPAAPGHDAHASAGSPGPGQKVTVKIDPLTFRIPDRWTNEPPSSSMRAGQIRLPRAEGDPEDGEIGIFYFGPGAGGIEANIQRWYGQMQRPDGSPVEQAARRESLRAGALAVTVIDVSGTLKASSMPGMPPRAEKKGYRMLAAIVEASNGPWFFKGTGPEKTMEAARAPFRAMLESMADSGSPPAR